MSPGERDEINQGLHLGMRKVHFPRATPSRRFAFFAVKVAIGITAAQPYWSRSLKPKKREVYELAVRLAQSGKMRNWQGIQEQLVEKGYKRAPDLLDSDKIRAVLDICCEESRSAQS